MIFWSGPVNLVLLINFPAAKSGQNISSPFGFLFSSPFHYYQYYCLSNPLPSAFLAHVFVVFYFKEVRHYKSNLIGRSRRQVRSQNSWKWSDPLSSSEDINFFAKHNPGCGNNIYIKTSSATPYIKRWKRRLRLRASDLALNWDWNSKSGCYLDVHSSSQLQLK